MGAVRERGATGGVGWRCKRGKEERGGELGSRSRLGPWGRRGRRDYVSRQAARGRVTSCGARGARVGVCERVFTSGRRRRRGLRAERVGRRAPSSHGLAHGVSWAAGRAGRGRAGGRRARCGRRRSRASGRGGAGWAGEGRLLGDGVADASRSERGRGRPGQDRRPRRAAGRRAAGDVGRQPLSPGAAGNWLRKKELSRRPGTVLGSEEEKPNGPSLLARPPGSGRGCRGGRVPRAAGRRVE